jgi:hypothetical protein
VAKAVGEAHIDDSNVNFSLVLGKVLQAGVHTSCSSNNLNIGLFSKNSPEGVSHHVMVIAEKNTNSH